MIKCSSTNDVCLCIMVTWSFEHIYAATSPLSYVTSTHAVKHFAPVSWLTYKAQNHLTGCHSMAFFIHTISRIYASSSCGMTTMS